MRVSDVTGPDELSRARIRTVAQLIHDQTGLDVDITVGSSPHQMTIALPQGRFGRPPLLLHEGWSRKGVSVTFLRALDRKDAGLFALVLVVCACFLINGGLAAVRDRRAQIATQLALGWPRAAIIRAVIGELALVGAAAGLAGTALAALLVTIFDLSFPVTATVFVLPIAIGLALLAALVPAQRAAATRPIDAFPPAATRGERRARVRRLAELALANLTRVKGRTALGASGLALGVAALTVLVSIQRGFQGPLVGTLLGRAISVQIRDADLVAVALAIGLAALSVADVVYLNLRDRAGELVTLQTVGWRDRHLIRLVALEALGLGVLGGLVGALVGFAVAIGLLGVPAGPVALATAAAAAAGIAAALVASLIPLAQLTRLTPHRTLAEE